MNESAPKLSGDRCQCCACGEYFNRVSLFDKHRHGPMDARACLTVDQMTAKGWRLNAAGFWVGKAGAFVPRKDS